MWDTIEYRLINRKHAFVFACPPCNTASRLRAIPGGPIPLRGVRGSDRYGLKNLSPADAEKVRLHNLLGIRFEKAVEVAASTNVPALLEQPEMREGEPSLLLLDEFARLLALQQISDEKGCSAHLAHDVPKTPR